MATSIPAVRALPRLTLLAAALAAVPHALNGQDAEAAQARRDTANALLRTQIRAALADAGVADPHGLLLVEGLRESGELQIRLLEGDVPDSALVRAYQRLHDRPGTWPGDTLRSLVRVDEDAYTGPVRVTPESGAEAENLRDLLRTVSEFGAQHPDLTAGGRAYTAWVETVITRGGNVAFSMVRGSSGNAQVDSFAAVSVAALRFKPVHVGDTPVDGWLSLPITVGPPGTQPGVPVTGAMGTAATQVAQMAATGDTSALKALHGLSHARLNDAFRELLAARGITRSDALLLFTRTGGGPAQVRVLEGTVPPGVLAAFDSVLQREVALWPDAYALDYVRAFEPVGQGGVERQPDLVNRGQIGAALGDYLETHTAIGRPGEQIDLRVKALISRAGTIPYVEIDRSSGNVHVDQSIMNILRRMKVQPARSGNDAIDTWITLPVTLELPKTAPAPPAPGQTPIRGDRTPTMRDGVRP